MRYGPYFLAAAAASIVAMPAAAADTPAYAPPGAWVAPGDTLPAGGTDTRPWLLAGRQVLIEADKRSTFTDTAVRIQSAEVLRNWSDISFEWQPDPDELIVHRIEIIRDGKPIDLLAQGLKLNVLQREKDFEQRAIDGRLTATAPIADLRVGDTVRFAATLVEHTDVLKGNGEAQVDLFAEPAPIVAGTVRIVWPKDLPVQWKAFGQGLAPVEADKGHYHIVTQAMPLAKQDEMPEDAPPRFHRPPALEFSTFASWTDLSRTIAPLYATDGAIAAGGSLAGEVDRIAAATSDPKARANAALRLVQNEIRYLYKGMENGNYVPQAPEATWSARYGDCKAKTLLLLAMLDRMGIAARPALVNSALGDLLQDRLPTLGAFDHVIVEASIDGTDYWLDGTAAGAHIEDLADVPPFEFALPLTVQGHDLETLPTRRPARPQIVVAVDYDQSAGTAVPPLFNLSFTLRGPMAAPLATLKAQAKPDQLRDFAQGTLGQFVGNGQIYSRSIEIDEEQGTATIHAKGIGNLPWYRDEERPYLTIEGILGDFNVEADRGRAAWRTIPVSTGNPMLMEYRFGLKLPADPGFATEGDARTDVEIAGIEMRRDARLADGRLVDVESLWTKGAELPADALPAARAQAAALKKDAFRVRAPAGYPSRVEEIARARKEKRFAPLLAAYQAAIDDDPDEANAYLNRAAFLRGTFDYRAAIADFDKAIELAPTVTAYQQRAWLKSALGDDAAALADVEEALKLDPGSENATGQKIELLTKLGRYDDALAMADDQMAGAKDKRTWISLKADALGKAGRAVEATALLADALTERPGDPGLLNALCWIRGTREVQLDAALKDCTRAIELSDDASAVLDSRAMVFFKLGRMEEARADLDAALKLAPDRPASLFLRGVVRSHSDDGIGAKTDLALARMQSGEIDKIYADYGVTP